MGREAFEGGEFDWFAVDGVGRVGHFSTAGYGQVLLPILGRLDSAYEEEVWSLGERMLELPLVGMATGHLPGEIDDWLELARRGILSFDWQHWSGPYLRAATPSDPIEITTLPTEFQILIRLVVLTGVPFAELESLRRTIEASQPSRSHLRARLLVRENARSNGELPI